MLSSGGFTNYFVGRAKPLRLFGIMFNEDEVVQQLIKLGSGFVKWHCKPFIKLNLDKFLIYNIIGPSLIRVSIMPPMSLRTKLYVTVFYKCFNNDIDGDSNHKLKEIWN